MDDRPSDCRKIHFIGIVSGDNGGDLELTVREVSLPEVVVQILCQSEPTSYPLGNC